MCMLNIALITDEQTGKEKNPSKTRIIAKHANFSIMNIPYCHIHCGYTRLGFVV